MAQVILTLARDNRVSDVRRAVVAGLSPVNFGNQIGQTALHIAALHGNVETVEVLLELGANANCRNQRETTPLHFAAGAKRNQQATVEALLKGGADPDARDAFGRQPYEGAEDESVRRLLGGPDPNFFKFASEGKLEQLKALLTKGGSQLVDSVDREGKSAALCAAEHGQAQVLKLLIEHGIDVNAQDETGNTPLHAAAGTGNSEIVNLLLEAKACPKIQNLRLNAYTSGQWLSHDTKGTLVPFDQCPLHIAAEQGDTEVAELLLKAGAKVSLTDFDGKTALHIALEENDVEMVELLLAQEGVNVDEGNADYDSPLHYLASRGRGRLIKRLVDLGAAVDKSNKEGWTPLHIAARTNNLDTVKTLLDAGCNPALLNSAGNTPLHMAAVNGRAEICKCLLERCPEAAAEKNKEGFIPADIAKNEDIKVVLA
eukprot:CAMPEP_0177751912 /NCGR_PEP_ID=MMETSP0491_2-20121128/637_1 /TAXON_ID=63592 /ORGANISM="Tetraselmis chuii, Strain PLY429" /LENGTH=428 /DNA_ID=CAMNT_0019267077 /DNA_START=145 /DNA_END=1431 /DNA_ORIENTATION=+